MKITNQQVNHIVNPMGFALDAPVFSWIAEDTPDRVQTAAQLILATDAALHEIVFDSGRQAGNAIDSLGYRPPLKLRPRTRYWWRITVWGETESANGDSWFETGKMDEPWQAAWIGPDFGGKDTHPILYRIFDCPSIPVSGRAYVCGLGLYQMEINGRKVGDEVLTPGCNAYDQWLQVQTYDITDFMQVGPNVLAVTLGNGWYKGRYSAGGQHPAFYGNEFALIAELRMELPGGETLCVATDEAWQAKCAPVLASDIYDGEAFDARLLRPVWLPGGECPVRLPALGLERLQDRRSLPVRIMEERAPLAVLTTPAGETVLDMGQNMVGWVRFRTDAPEGTVIRLQYGEVLQGGNFYRENLRTALQEYTYTANGERAVAEPLFTFYGFRYVKVIGWPGPMSVADFTGCVIHSDMPVIGSVETSNEKVNQLFRNALWGQRGNFVDIPTDCPQRDERLGWTGDTQVFAGTACFNMDTAAFYAKYAYDCALEQRKRGGMVPDVVPSVDTPGGGSCAWGDVATILPWTVYEFTGDISILERQFESMRAWVNYIRSRDEASGGRRLWTTGFHYGDWLALDGPDPQSPMGGTADDYIASSYYYVSAKLTARAAAVLGRAELHEEYRRLSDEVLAAIRQEFFTPTGRLAVETQTGYVLALHLGLAPEAYRERLMRDFKMRLRRDKGHLRTGFVGTPWLCRALSANGAHDLACKLLLHEDYPSWLYAVNLGATTIWERWNTLNPDGSVSSTGMNSLNHYAYGSIVEWMYRDLCGLNPAGEDGVMGFRHARLTPRPDPSLRWVNARHRSASGDYACGWELTETGVLRIRIEIPFNSTARVILPYAPETVLLNGQPTVGERKGTTLALELSAGSYTIEYGIGETFKQRLSTRTPIVQLVNHTGAKAILVGLSPLLSTVDDALLANLGDASIRDMASTPFLTITDEQLDELDTALGALGRE